MARTKIEFNAKKIDRIRTLDELAALLFPGNRNHQKVFLAIFIEIKYTDNGFLPHLRPLCEKYEFSPRMLETVRSKAARLGLIEHISRLNKKLGYRDGWVFSSRFSRSLARLAELVQDFKERKDPLQERKDLDLLKYL
ncbi:MAG: hypothetical protein ABSB22_15240 [Thermodesulfobacteriota bacterium]|jgi:hypothetical protein